MSPDPDALTGALDTATPILVLGLSRGPFHHGVLGMARSAGRLGVPVHRIGRERFAPSVGSRYMTGSSVIGVGASEQEIREALSRISGRIGRAILVAADDAASVFVDEHAGELEAEFLIARQPAGLAAALSSKRGMYELCQQHAVPTPHSSFPETEPEVREHAERAGYPTVVKCINAGEAPAGAPRVMIAQNAQELIGAFRRMRSSERSNLMLQEYIPGTIETVWMFNGYFDRDSECRIGLTGRKIRQSPPYTGATTLGVCLPNEAVRETTVRFMKELGYRGILDIGYRYDARDGEYKLLDVNPRIGATFRLFAGENGMDVLRALHLDLTGRAIPPTSLPAGRRWLVEPLDVRSSLVYRRRGELTFRQWARSLRGVRETAWLALDDPLPVLALGARVLAESLLRRTPRG